jgi:hypothetical protein
MIRLLLSTFALLALGDNAGMNSMLVESSVQKLTQWPTKNPPDSHRARFL